MRGKSRSMLASMLIIALMAALMIPTSAFGVKAAGGVDVQVAYFAPDKYEPDNTMVEAYEYDPEVDGNTFYSVRTFDGANDVADDVVDYIAVTVEDTGTPIWVETMFLQGEWDSYVYIYDSEGVTLVTADDNDVWSSTYSEGVYYEVPEPGTYYVGVENRSYMAKYELYITVGDARRVAGSTRYATAAAVSRLQWDNTNSNYYGYGYGPDDIIIANGNNPTDALAGGSLAAQLGGVLLLTNKDYLPTETYNEIVRLTESLYWDEYDVNVWVLGGEGVVSDTVFKKLAGMRTVTHVNRISGSTRYETAAAIADTISAEDGLGTNAYIVNGSSWADALAVAPVAAFDNAPVLMTAASDVPTATMDWLADNGIINVVVVGGTGAVSAAAYDELDALYSVQRIAGDSRYETAKEVALHGLNLGMDGRLPTLVSGANFADALSAAPISWWTGSPMLLTTPAELHEEVYLYFEETGSIGFPYTVSYTDEGMGCYVLGGTGAISEAAYEEFRDLWMGFIEAPL